MNWDKLTDKAGNLNLEAAFYLLTYGTIPKHSWSQSRALQYIRNVQAIQLIGNAQTAAVVLAQALLIYDPEHIL